MTYFFEFEADFVDSWRCIPMQVRYKLDTCGIKLKLAEWNQMNQTNRKIANKMNQTNGIESTNCESNESNE